MNRPTFSVLMAVYNGERYVAGAVASVLAQAYADFEFIVIDDGSTDSTRRVLDKFQDPRLRVYGQRNLGLTASLNRALLLASGRWIARQDADDLSLYLRFERQKRFLDANREVQLLGTSILTSNPWGLINEIQFYPQTDSAIKRALTVVNPFGHGSVVVDRALLEASGGYNERYRYVQDYELWSRILFNVRAANLREPLYARMRHAGTSEATVNKEAIFNEIRDRLVEGRRTLEQLSTPGYCPITTAALWPVIARPSPYARWLADSYARIAAVCRRYSLPWFKAWATSFLYCPWRRGSSGHARRLMGAC